MQGKIEQFQFQSKRRQKIQQDPVFQLDDHSLEAQIQNPTRNLLKNQLKVVPDIPVNLQRNKQNSQLYVINEDDQGSKENQDNSPYLTQIQQLQKQLYMLQIQQLTNQQAKSGSNSNQSIDLKNFSPNLSPVHARNQDHAQLFAPEQKFLLQKQENITQKIKALPPKQEKSGTSDVLSKGLKSIGAITNKAAGSFMNQEKSANKKYMSMMTMGKSKPLDETFKKEHILLYYIQYGYIGFKHIVLPIVVLVSSLLCMLNLILWNYYNIGMLGSDTLEFLLVSDQFMAALFIIEIIFNIIEGNGLIELADFENMTLMLIIFEINWTMKKKESNIIFDFIHFLRSLRITKLRYISRLFTHYVKKYILQLKMDDLSMEQTIEKDEEGEMNQFIYESLIKFNAGIMIQSSLFLAIDKILDYKGYYPFCSAHATQKFDYLNAAYFTIVTFGTIGYGDIYPNQTVSSSTILFFKLSRLVAVCICVLNITIMSNFLGKFIEHLFALSPYSKDYDFKDHVVVIGDMTNDKRRDFMEELIENDIVERDMNNPIGQLTAGIKCIFVSEKEPSSQMRMQAIYYTEKHDNEIVFLKDHIYSQGKKWYKKSNLKEAKIIFAFSKECDNEFEGFEQDKLMSLTAKNTKETYPKLRVMLVLNTEFKQLIDMDSFYSDIENISPRQMNEFLLATSLENPGLSTSLQHLLTMKSKTMSKEILHLAHYDQFLFSYIRDMQSEIYQVQMPDFFVGMSFRKCAQVLFLHQLRILNGELDVNKFIQTDENQQMINLIAIETSAEDHFNTMENESARSLGKEVKPLSTFNDWAKRENTKTPSTQLGQINKSAIDNLLMKIQLQESKVNQQISDHRISSEINQISQQSQVQHKEQFESGQEHQRSPSQNSQHNVQSEATEKKSKLQTQILINPQNYSIRKNDIGYVVCDNHEVAINIKQISSVDSEKYLAFLKNYSHLKRNVGNSRLRKIIIEEMFQQLSEKDTLNNEKQTMKSSQNILKESDQFPQEVKQKQIFHPKKSGDQQDKQQSLKDELIQFENEDKQEQSQDEESQGSQIQKHKRSLAQMSERSQNQSRSLEQSFVQSDSAESVETKREDIFLKSKMYDFNEEQFPEAKLNNHIIIVGKINKFANYINLLRKYSNRSIVLFTQDSISLKKWNEKRSRLEVNSEHCYIFKGQYLNLVHIDQLAIKTSYQILLSTQLFCEEFPDAIGLCLAKIISDYYDQSNFLIEVLDDEKLQFLRKNIRFKQIKQVPSFLYQTFMQGNVHFRSMITGMLVRVIYNPSWLRLFQDIAVPKSYTNRVQNQTMNCVQITKDAMEVFKYFGCLQYGLLESKPSLVALSLIKNKIKSRYSEYPLEELMRQPAFASIQKKYYELIEIESCEQYSMEMKQIKFLEYVRDTLGKFIGNKFVLTNPAFYTPLEIGDQVLIIGDFKIKQQQQKKQISHETPKVGVEEVNKALSNDLADDSLSPSNNFKDRSQRDFLIQKCQHTYKEYEERKDLKDILKRELQKKIKTFQLLENNHGSRIREVAKK